MQVQNAQCMAPPEEYARQCEASCCHLRLLGAHPSWEHGQTTHEQVPAWLIAS